VETLDERGKRLPVAVARGNKNLFSALLWRGGVQSLGPRPVPEGRTAPGLPRRPLIDQKLTVYIV